MSKKSKDTYLYFKGNLDKDFVISSMKKYIKEKQELDKFLEKIISPFIKDKKLKILDSCCGLGHISYLLSRISPCSTFLWVDQNSYLVEKAKKIFKEEKNLSFKISDLQKLNQKYAKKFDITINWKTLSWLPYYEEMLKAVIMVTKSNIFLSSLFYEGDIDFEIKVREYKKETWKIDFNAFYNVYSLPKFTKKCYELGVKKVEVFDFEIKKDLKRPPLNQMGTYTVMLNNGKRLQISGTVIMNWKIIRLDL